MNADIELTGPRPDGALRALAAHGAIASLTIRGHTVFGRRHANELLTLPSVESLRLWCPVTRAAVGLLLEIPGLRHLELAVLRAGGRFEGFATPRELECFDSACSGLEADDLVALARSPSLRVLRTMDVKMTAAAFDALLDMPQLESLSLESCSVGDALLARLRPGGALRRLLLAVNPLTGEGLRHIVRLPKLRELDLWETDIVLEDLQLLQQLPQLESLSLGAARDRRLRRFPPMPLLAMLDSLPALRQLELDGIALDKDERAAYAARFADLRVLQR